MKAKHKWLTEWYIAYLLVTFLRGLFWIIAAGFGLVAILTILSLLQ